MPEHYYKRDRVVTQLSPQRRSIMGVPMEETIGVTRDFGPRREIDMLLRKGGVWSDMRAAIQQILDAAPDSTEWRPKMEGGKVFVDTKEDLVNDLKSTLMYEHDIENDNSIVARVDPNVEAMRSGFYWFANRREFTKYFAQLKPEQRVLHEVVKQTTPRKIVFDIDAKQKDIDSQGVTREKIFGDIMASITATFKGVYGHDLVEGDFMICDSSNENKFSRHVYIKDYHVVGADQFKYLLNAVGSCLNTAYKECSQFLDINATKGRYSSLRMLGCHKPADPARVKRLITPGVKAMETLIGLVSATSTMVGVSDSLIDHSDGGRRYAGENMIAAAMLKLADSCPFIDMNNFSVRSCDGDFITLDRVDSSYCHICIREHENDGMYIVRQNKDVYLHCFGSLHRAETVDAKPIKLGVLPWDASMIEIYLTNSGFEYGLQGSLTDSMPNSQTICTEEMPDYTFSDDVDTLLVRSCVGTGKTKALIRYLEKENPAKVLVFSFRRTFTDDMTGKVPFLSDYRCKTGELDMRAFNRLIVQVESIHRLRVTDDAMPDLVVFDEIESILAQIDHSAMTCHGTLDRVLTMMGHVAANAKKAIFLDAYLGQRSIDFITTHRSKLASIDNTHQGRSDYSFIAVPDAKLYSAINNALSNDKRCVLVCCEKRFAKGAYEYFSERYPSKRIKIYTGETSNMKNVKEDLKDVNNAWKDVDMLIYTSSILAGCSYENHTFDVGFAHLNNSTLHPQQIFQMLQRVRNLADKTYIISVAPNLRDYGREYCSKERIFKSMEAHINRVSTRLDERNTNDHKSVFDGLIKEHAYLFSGESKETGIEDGMAVSKLKNDWKVDTLIDAVCHKARGRQFFLEEFVRILRIQGCTLDCLMDDDTPPEEIKHWRNTIKVANEIGRIMRADAIAAAPIPDSKEKQRIMSADHAHTPQECDTITRLDLAKYYRIPAECVTTKFVTEYDTKVRKKVFNNLDAVTKKLTISESVDALEIEEEEEFRKAKRSGVKLAKLKRTAGIHRVTVGILASLGFDVSKWRYPHGHKFYVATPVLKENMTGSFCRYIEENIDAINLYRGRPFDLAKFLKSRDQDKMQILNGLIRPVYGISLAPATRARKEYFLSGPSAYMFHEGRYWPFEISRDAIEKTLGENAARDVEETHMPLTAIEEVVDQCAAELRSGVLPTSDEPLAHRAAYARTGIERTVRIREPARLTCKREKRVFEARRLVAETRESGEKIDKEIADETTQILGVLNLPPATDSDSDTDTSTSPDADSDTDTSTSSDSTDQSV